MLLIGIAISGAGLLLWASLHLYYLPTIFLLEK